MKQQLKLAGIAALFGIVASAAVAQEKLKIGVIVTLSGPAAALGAQVRDGFTLAVKDLGGKMAGRDVEIIAVDDELKPDDTGCWMVVDQWVAWLDVLWTSARST